MEGMLVLIIGGGIIWYIAARNKKLRDEGKIIQRGSKFEQEAEEFTVNLENPAQVESRLQQLPYSDMRVSMHQSGENAFGFTSDGWTAELFLKERRGGKCLYCFQFLNWKTHNGLIVGELQMNMLLTAVEKMFLDIAPDTQVRTRLIETKTKHKIF